MLAACGATSGHMDLGLAQALTFSTRETQKKSLIKICLMHIVLPIHAFFFFLRACVVVLNQN